MTSRRALLAVLSLVTVIGVWVWVTKDRTIYASRFREDVFETIKPGMSRAQVEDLLGKPLLEQEDPFPETWFYQESVRPGESRVFRMFQSSETVSFDPSGQVIKTSGIPAAQLQGARDRKSILRALGSPRRKIQARAKCAYYSRSSPYGLYKARIVAYTADDLVAEIFAYEAYD